MALNADPKVENGCRAHAVAPDARASLPESGWHWRFVVRHAFLRSRSSVGASSLHGCRTAPTSLRDSRPGRKPC